MQKLRVTDMPSYDATYTGVGTITGMVTFTCKAHHAWQQTHFNVLTVRFVTHAVTGFGSQKHVTMMHQLVSYVTTLC